MVFILYSDKVFSGCIPRLRLNLIQLIFVYHFLFFEIGSGL